jgi:hypothetical protein
MLPHAHFGQELPELPTISFLHLDHPYAQAVPAKAIAAQAHRTSTVQRGEARHAQASRETNKERGA